MKDILRKIFLVLMLIQTAFWLVTGIFTYYTSGIYINILLIINGLLFALFAAIYKKNKLFKVGCVLFLVTNTILTLTDQTGVFDYIILAVNIVSLIFFTLSLTLKKASK